jgi:hypothetical protein
MVGRRLTLGGVGGFVVAATIAFAIVCGGIASARPIAPRPHVVNRAPHRSFLHLLHRRAAIGHALSLRARAAIVGGGQIAITQAPWQAEVFAEFAGGGGLACGGAILDSTHILTAAHCTFDLETGERLAPEAFVVVAGSASVTVEEIKNNPALQAVFISAARVHPMYAFSLTGETPDDVAVLTLEKPLTLNATVQQIGLASAGPSPAEGARANLTGFGKQNPNSEADQSLYSIGMTVGSSEQCGREADAVFVCASTPTGTACSGDSGSALTAGTTPTLVGVMDTVAVVSGEQCRDGATDGFANVAAPEIRDFIEGSETPPPAPRGGGGIVVRAVPQVGHTVTCEPGAWTGSPTFTYSFVNSANGQTLQAGSVTTYPLTAADVGRTIYCALTASNAGGTGGVRTKALRPIEALATPAPAPTPEGSAPSKQPLPTPPPPSTLALAAASLTTQSTGAVSVKLDCVGSQSCTGKLTLQAARAAKKKRGRKATGLITIGRASFSIAAGKTANVTIHLNGSGRALLTAGHGRLTAHLLIVQAGAAGIQTRTVHLVEKPAHSRGKRKR